MIARDFTLLGMVVSLAACLSIIVYATAKRVKLDDGNPWILLVGLASVPIFGLVVGGVHIWGPPIR